MGRGAGGGWSGLPWQSGGLDSALPVQGVRFQSLVRELRPHMLSCEAKKILKEKSGCLSNKQETFIEEDAQQSLMEETELHVLNGPICKIC